MSYIGNLPTNVAFVTDQFNGDGSTVAFTMSVAPASTSSILVAITGVLQDPSTYAVSGTTLTFSAAPPSGTGNISVRYLGIPASGVTTTAYRTITDFTATAGQTTFTPPSYTVGYIDVYRNGSKLGLADFTATNGTTVVLANACNAGDLVETQSFYVSSVLNAIPATAGAVNSTYIANGAVGSSALASSLSLVTPTVTTTMGVGGATPAASGSGITFPATQSASSDVNTLDDYEEGSWTPTAYGESSAGTTTYAARNGTYTKIGRLVYARGYINPTAMTGTGLLYIGGLPFVCDVSYPGTGYTMADALDLPATGNLTLYVSANETAMRLFVSTDNINWQATSCENGTWALHFTIVYMASA